MADISDVTVVVGVPVAKTEQRKQAAATTRRKRCICCVVTFVVLAVLVAVLASCLHTYHHVSNRMNNFNKQFNNAHAKVDFSGSHTQVETELESPPPQSAHGVTVSRTTCVTSLEGQHLATVSLDGDFKIVQSVAAASNDKDSSCSLTVDSVTSKNVLWLASQSAQTQFSDEKMSATTDVVCDVGGHFDFVGLVQVPFSTTVATTVDLDLESMYSALHAMVMTVVDPDSPSTATSGPLASLVFVLPSVSYDVGLPEATHRVVSSDGSFNCKPEGCELHLNGDAALRLDELPTQNTNIVQLVAPLSFNEDDEFGLFAVAQSDNALTTLMGNSHSVVLLSKDSFSTRSRTSHANRDGVTGSDHHDGDSDHHHGRQLGNPNAVPYVPCNQFAVCYLLPVDAVNIEACFDLGLDLNHLWANATVEFAGSLPVVDAALGWSQVSSDGTVGIGDVLLDIVSGTTQVFLMDGIIEYRHDKTAIDVEVADTEIKIHAFYAMGPPTTANAVGVFDIGFSGTDIGSNGQLHARSMGTLLLHHDVYGVTVPGVSANVTLRSNMSEADMHVVVHPLSVLSFHPAKDTDLPTLLDVVIRIGDYEDADVHASAEGSVELDLRSRALLQQTEESSSGESFDSDSDGPNQIELFAALDPETMHMETRVVGGDAVAILVRKLPDSTPNAAADALMYDFVVLVTGDSDVHVPTDLIRPRPDGTIDYDAIANFSAGAARRCGNCTYGEEPDDTWYSRSLLLAESTNGSSSEDEGDEEKGGFFDRGNYVGNLVQALSAVTMPIVDARATGFLASSAHARSFVHVGYWAAHASSTLLSATNSWLDAEFHGAAVVDVERHLATLDLDLMSSDASGISTVQAGVIGFVSHDAEQRFDTGLRARLTLQGDLSDSAYEADAAFVDITSGVVLVHNVTNQTAFKAPEWTPPTPAEKAASDAGRPPSWVDTIVGAATTAPAVIASALSTIAKGFPSGESVVTSSVTVLETRRGGLGTTSQGRVHYASHPADPLDFDLWTNTSLNASVHFRPHNETARLAMTLQASSIAASATVAGLCPTANQLEFHGNLAVPAAFVQGAVDLNLDSCVTAPAISGDEVVRFGGINALLIGAGATIVNASGEVDGVSSSLAESAASSLPFVVHADMHVAAMGGGLFDANGSSTVVLGSNQNEGGFRTSHDYNVMLPPLQLAVSAKVADFDMFYDNDLLALSVTELIAMGGPVFMGDVGITVVCGPQCSCGSACSTAQLLTRPPVGELRDYGRHGFSSLVSANITVAGMGVVADVPVMWTPSSPNGEGNLTSTLHIGGKMPILVIGGNPFAAVDWKTTIGPSDPSNGPLPLVVTVSDLTEFNFSSKFNLTAGSIDVQALVDVHKQYSSVRGHPLFLTALELWTAGESQLKAHGEHVFLPVGAGFNSSHAIDLPSLSAHAAIPQLDFFTGPDVIRAMAHLSGPEFDQNVSARVHLASPAGFAVARVVDFATQTTDAALNVAFFFQNYTAAMAHFNKWHVSTNELSLNVDPMYALVRNHHDFGHQDPATGWYTDEFAWDFSTNFIGMADLAVGGNAVVHSWWDASGDAAGDALAEFNAVLPLLDSAAEIKFRTFSNYSRDDEGSGWDATTTIEADNQMHFDLTFDSESVFNADGYGHFSEFDDREAADAGFTYHVDCDVPSTLGTKVVRVDVDGEGGVSHYSGVARALVNVTGMQDMTIAFVTTTTKVFDTSLEVWTCGDADACELAGGDEDHDSVCSDNDSCPADQENDADSDSVCGNVDSCPYDAENDADGDDLCGDVDSCPYSAGNDKDEDGICFDQDSCPLDAENDADSDQTCGDEDDCPYDAENDADRDDICGDGDQCPYDAENDADSDSVCGDVDSCAYDAANDEDADGLCADVDDCPLDPENDADKDGKCAANDACPYDYFDDIDSDGVCDSEDPCPYEADVTECTIIGCDAVGGDADSDGICGRSDICPVNTENDADADNICENSDSCPLDDDNDADSDQICGDVDSCPLDADNDADNDGRCGNRDRCPFDSADDADDDGLCADVDACPNDADNDIDSDSVCGDVDSCPNDPDNDSDNDQICGDIDSCPNDGHNDADGDDICGDIDSCPTDNENDADGDDMCAALDPCPYDADNDEDGDDLCADVDSCPRDMENDSDGNGVCEVNLPSVSDPLAAASVHGVSALVSSVVALVVATFVLR
eukprot:INCI4355.1.p1 GENE.INCI4355.1~~INCI4355.1.p1  ORF type:complete len:2186 (-),score=507.55 INCI4355.1:1227-7784(-)